MKCIKKINDGWFFRKITKQEFEECSVSSADLKIDVPHTWYVDGGDSNKGYAVYIREISPVFLNKEEIYLKFYGVSRQAVVVFNGHKLAFHEGSYSAFTVRIPKSIVSLNNKIAVFVSNEASDTISPTTGDFTVFGGITRTVELITFDTSNHFDMTYYGTDGVVIQTDYRLDAKGHVKISPHLNVSREEINAKKYIHVNVFYDGEKIVNQQYDILDNINITIDNPVLWEGKLNPALYDVEVSLYSDGKCVDRVEKRIGFRHVQVDTQSGAFLNGKKIKLRGVAKHADFAQVFGAITSDHIQKDFELISEIGANAVRLSHYQHSDYAYEKCDELGLVVWAEIPLLKVNHVDGFYENIEQQLLELMYQNMHHPSICFWGIQNEIAIFSEDEPTCEVVRRLYELAEKHDTTRIITSANLFIVSANSPLNHITKMVGYNLYFGWYYGKMEEYSQFVDSIHQENPKIALGISEYGVDCNLSYHSSNPKVKDYTEEFQSLFHETVYPILESKEYLWGSFIWNMFDFSSEIRDEGGQKYQNHKGLVTYDRKIKKDAFYYYKAKWSDDPFVHIAEKRFVNRHDAHTKIKVYTNQKEVTLFIRDETYVSESDNGMCLFDNITLSDGENKINVKSGVLKDDAVFIKVTEPDSSYVFVDTNSGVNVQNWFETDEQKEAIFPTDKYSIMDKMSELLENDTCVSILRELMPEHIEDMLERRGNMPLHRVIHYLKIYTEEDVKEINRRLISVKK